MGQDAGRGAMWCALPPDLVSVDLLCWLVKPCGHTPLPVLVEVELQDRAISAGHHGCSLQASSVRERPPERDFYYYFFFILQLFRTFIRHGFRCWRNSNNRKGEVHANGRGKIENKQEIGKVVSESQNKIA